MQHLFDFEAVRYDEWKKELVILDQTLLPGEMVYLRLSQEEEILEAIANLRVRGAPAIGIAAAYGIFLGMIPFSDRKTSEYLEILEGLCHRFGSVRPTAVNLSRAMERIWQRVLMHRMEPPASLSRRILEEALSIQEEDQQMCRMIGKHGLGLLQPGWGLLTHCNAGHLATSGGGTALAPIYEGALRDYHFRVFVDETRPLLQGARLTAFELMHAGIDTTLICDNMASVVMENGWVQAILTGCDRVARNGDTANKIGTQTLAILAAHHGIPLYICAPSSTLDPACTSGKDIRIEERSPEEITERGYKNRMAPPGVKVFNPAFDVTDHQLISAIVTEKGIFRPPYDFSS